MSKEKLTVQMRSVDFKKAFPIITVLLVFISAVFLASYSALSTYQPTDPFWINIMTYVMRAFKWGPLALFIAWLFNIIGYLHAKARDASNTISAEVKYDMNKYFETTLYYLEFSIPFFVALPEPYNMIGIALATLVKVVRSEWKQLKLDIMRS